MASAACWLPAVAWAVVRLEGSGAQRGRRLAGLAAGFTLPLAASGAPILAVEVDRDLVADLTPRMPPNVTLMTGDVMKTDVLPFLTGLQPNLPPATAGAPPPRRRYRLVGNLPYNLSTPILFRLLEWQQATSLFHDATVMLQREVAERAKELESLLGLRRARRKVAERA